jgi:ketosteroid isomerase-like protein
VAYPVPPVPQTITGRENLYGFVSGMAGAVGEIRVSPVALHHTDDPHVVISQHQLSVDLLDGSQYENTYISVIRLRDGLIASVLEFYGSREHAGLLASLGVTA